MYRFANNGESGAPCGVPRPSSLLRVVRCVRPRSSVSSTGASSHILIRCSRCRSLIRRATTSSVRRAECCRNTRSSPRRPPPYARDPASAWTSCNASRRTVPGAVGVLLRLQVRLEDRLQDQHRRHLHHAVADRRNPQRSLLAVRLSVSTPAAPACGRYVFCLQFLRQFVQPRSTPVLLDVRRTSGRPRPLPPVGPAALVGMGQHVRGDTPCRTGHRTDSSALPSLWHAAPPGVSQPFVEVVDSSPISWLSLLLALSLN